MFGWRKSITNLECEIISVEGYLSGLNNRLISLINISNDPDYKGNLSDEIKRVESEIKEMKLKLKKLILKK
jgi:hypothetical protein